MGNRHQPVIAIGLLLIGFVGLRTLAAPPKRPSLAWYESLHAAHKVSVRRQKPMLLVFHADWCGYCKKLERAILSDPRMIDYINKSFVPVHLDLDKEKRIAEVLEVKSIPCSIVLSPDADLLGKLVGYVEADKYRKTLESTQRLYSVVRKAKAIRESAPRRVTSRETSRRGQ